MVNPAAPPTRRKRNGEFSLPQSDSLKARIFLLAACIWPLILFALFASSAPHVHPNDQSAASPHSLKVDSQSISKNIRNILDRVDILGYGPTHPRVAVVIVGDNKDDLLLTLESVFLNTDMNRIFIVVVVVDGMEEDAQLVKDLKKIDQGTIPHWHGLRPDLHQPGQQEDEDDPHGRKVHVMFNEEKLGVAESREDAVEFIRVLKENHEHAGLKAPEEDLILLLMQSGTQLTSRKWLPPVTEALIVPPPLLGEGDSTVALKIANAVAFNLEGPRKRTSFDTTFARVISEPNAEEISLSNGESYPTPALNGAATALRLETFMNLPSHDLSLVDAWQADLDLALNLWLCADGIDMIKDLEITSIKKKQPAPLPPEAAARFAASWMDDVTNRKFFNSYVKVYSELTYLEWETLMAKAQEQPSFTKGLAKRCRSFQWYAENINPDVSTFLEESDEVVKEEEAKEDSQSEETSKKTEKKEKVQDAADSDEDGEEDISIPERKGDKKKPSMPLCKECLEIVQRARPIDISFVDVSGGHKEHPHLGALDENGKPGYVHDETALHKNPPEFTFQEEKLRKGCLRRDNNYKMLHEKVYVDLEAEKQAEMSGKERDTLFCLVYTIDQGHPKIPNIRETWGPKCDGFMVASNKTDPTIGAVNIPHEGEEDYDNIWQKVRSMWSYVYDNYYEKYDWFHIGGDDLYLIVENLRYYLESEEIKTAANGGIYLPDGTETVQTPLFLGRRFAYGGDMNDIFNSGGSGYTLNKAALKTLVAKGFPQYFPHFHTFSEDTMVARVLRKFGVYPYDTKDEFGGERYMPFLPGHHYGYRMPQDKSKDWYALYSINVKEGKDHCAARAVAFHYVKDDMMKRLHALLYNLCPPDTLETE